MVILIRFHTLKVELSKYPKGVRWLRDLLYGVYFSADRVHIVASKMTNDVARLKRDGRKIVQTLMKTANYKEGVCGLTYNDQK